MLEADNRLDQFRAFLEQKGTRLTRERAIVATLVFASSRPVDADALYDEARRQSWPVSRATVFRTLAYLQEAGLANFRPQ